MLRFEKRAIDLGNMCEASSVFDVNNDGHADIVSGEYWYEGPDFIKKHRICDIKFDGNYVHDFSDYPMDVDGDGYTDIITGSWWGGGLYWRRNPGPKGGEWETLKIMDLGNVETIRYHDVDGDGHPEIIPNCPGEPPFFVRLGRGKDGRPNGEFKKHVLHDHPQGHGLGIGDVDGDGYPEIIVPNGIFRMVGGDAYCGRWERQDDCKAKAGWSVPVIVHDVDGDGMNDLILGYGHGYGLVWLKQGRDGSGGRTWEERVIDGAWSQYHDMQLADIDGDGKPELVTGKRYKAHNGNDPGDDGDVFICYYKFRDGGLYRHVVDCGDPAKGHSGVGIYLWLHDLSGNGLPDIVAPGKEGLYLFTNHGPE